VELTGLGSLNLPPVAVLAQAYARDDASEHAEAVSQAAYRLLGWYAQQVNPENGTAETATMGACE
jgi:hypothetical protein